MIVTIKVERETYRRRWNQLLEAEIALKDQTERVAVLRRQLRAGSLVETGLNALGIRVELCRVSDIPS